MVKPFQSYDALRLFVIVARHLSFTAASSELNLTKGAISYQIKQLERDLGFKLFLRVHNGIMLTEKGKRLQIVAVAAFEGLEQDISQLQTHESASITIGTSTYFASRWLSSRLMTFMIQNPYIHLRLQPVIGTGDLRAEKLDLMIRWGTGNWSDGEIERLFHCPAIATAGAEIAQQIQTHGLANIMSQATLLHDCEDSIAWRDWHVAAGLAYRPKQNPLVIPDPNVRVEAVVNGQGVALNDWLISAEIDAKRLYQISPVELPHYGYFLAYAHNALENPALRAFRDWVVAEASTTSSDFR